MGGQDPLGVEPDLGRGGDSAVVEAAVGLVSSPWRWEAAGGRVLKHWNLVLLLPSFLRGY